MPQRYIGDGSRAAQDADASLSAAREGGDAVHDIGGVCDFHNVRSEGVGAVTGDDYGGLGLVLGSGRATTRAAVGFSSSTGSGDLGEVVVVNIGGGVGVVIVNIPFDAAVVVIDDVSG